MKAKIVGNGGKCPKCRNPMLRCEHKENWAPRKNQPFYFRYWDKCKKCRHIQHYESAKIHLGMDFATELTETFKAAMQ